MANPPIVWEIDSDPVLSGVKLIAEAWDAGGLYQVGSFGQDKWKEWNGRFRHDIRSFVKGDQNTVSKLRQRVTGSLDLYKRGERPAGQSVNFVTRHDGFTLNDLVWFDRKHNDANLELNSDGTNANLSWNCGIEGSSGDAVVEQLRGRQIRNFFTLTLLSVGTPMLLMSDEARRTQQGKNNGYCQDNEISWFDWSLCLSNADLLRFVRNMIRIRLNFNQETEGRQISFEECLRMSRIEWHGVELGKPDREMDSHSIAFTLYNIAVSQVRYFAINAYWLPLDFKLPPVSSKPDAAWLRLVDTSLPSPQDVTEEGMVVPVSGSHYTVNPRSIVMLHCDNAQVDQREKQIIPFH